MKALFTPVTLLMTLAVAVPGALGSIGARSACPPYGPQLYVYGGASDAVARAVEKRILHCPKQKTARTASKTNLSMPQVYVYGGASDAVARAVEKWILQCRKPKTARTASKANLSCSRVRSASQIH